VAIDGRITLDKWINYMQSSVISDKMDKLQVAIDGRITLDKWTNYMQSRDAIHRYLLSVHPSFISKNQSIIY
jgi:hypothetical protein